MMSVLKGTAKELMIIIGISVLFGFAVNTFSPKGIALFGNWDTSKGVISAKSKGDENYFFEEIEEIQAAKEIFDRGGALFLDARHPDAYHEGHIPGAVSLPVGRFDEMIEGVRGRYPASTSIITYCSGRECEDSHNLARLLFMEGYTHIRIFIDGYPGWEEMGYPRE
jgi:rhodanese-related sulfurtransferase